MVAAERGNAEARRAECTHHRPDGVQGEIKQARSSGGHPGLQSLDEQAQQEAHQGRSRKTARSGSTLQATRGLRPEYP